MGNYPPAKRQLTSAKNWIHNHGNGSELFRKAVVTNQLKPELYVDNIFGVQVLLLY